MDKKHKSIGSAGYANRKCFIDTMLIVFCGKDEDGLISAEKHFVFIKQLKIAFCRTRERNFLQYTADM